MIKTKLILSAIAVVAVVGAVGFVVGRYQLGKSTVTNGGPAIVAAVIAPVNSSTTASTTAITQTSTTLAKISAATSTSSATTSSAIVTSLAIKAKQNAAVGSASNATASAPTQATQTSPALALADITAGVRDPITVPLADQKTLASETVAIVCINPILPGRTGTISFGSGVIVNKNGYIVTNEHVVASSTACYMGRTQPVPQYFQSSFAPAPTIALYYSLKLIGTGVGVTDPSDENQTSSFHDFAVLKIDAKMPRSEWQSDQAPPLIRTLSATYIPWATDAQYEAFSPSGTYPAISINFNYQPTRGDLLSMGGYIADTGIPAYTFADGNLSVFSTSTLSVAMPTGQGLSGSAIVDSQGNMVALNFAMDCGEWQGCYTWDNPNDINFSSFTYGNQALALTIPFLNQAMEEDLGFSLQQLTTMN